MTSDAFAATGQGLLGNNTFVYCSNNPIILIDSSGMRPIAYSSDGKETEEMREWSYAYMNKKLKIDITEKLTSFM